MVGRILRASSLRPRTHQDDTRCTKPKPIPPPVSRRRWRRTRSTAARPSIPTSRSRSFSAGSATPTFTPSTAKGTASCPRPFPACRATRSSAWSPRWCHFGGFSESIVVDESFVLKVPGNLDLAGVAPLLCAGITTYSPMRHWGVKEGMKVGVVGLGGLGHMGVKFARAFGAHVVVFTRSDSKVEDAIRLGAYEVANSRNADEMAKHAGSFNFILDRFRPTWRSSRSSRSTRPMSGC